MRKCSDGQCPYLKSKIAIFFSNWKNRNLDFMHGGHVRSKTQVTVITLHRSAAVWTTTDTSAIVNCWWQQLLLIPHMPGGGRVGSHEQQVGGRCLVRRGGMGALTVVHCDRWRPFVNGQTQTRITLHEDDDTTCGVHVAPFSCRFHSLTVTNTRTSAGSGICASISHLAALVQTVKIARNSKSRFLKNRISFWNFRIVHHYVNVTFSWVHHVLWLKSCMGYAIPPSYDN